MCSYILCPNVEGLMYYGSGWHTQTRSILCTNARVRECCIEPVRLTDGRESARGSLACSSFFANSRWFLSLSLSLSLSSGRQISGPWAIRIVNFKTRGASKTETELMKIYERASAFVKTFQWTTEERALSTLSVQRLTAYSYSCIRWKIMLIRPRFFDAPSTVDIFIKCH